MFEIKAYREHLTLSSPNLSLEVSHIPRLLYYFPIIGTPVYRLLLCKSIDWFLYDKDTRHEKVYVITTLNITYHNICL